MVNGLNLPRLQEPWRRHHITGGGRSTFCAVNWDTGEVQVEAQVMNDEWVPAEKMSEEDKQSAVRSVVYWMRGDEPDWGSQHKLEVI